MTKYEQRIKNAISLEFCKALNSSPQKVTDAMNSAPCFLGSEKHFEQTVKAVLNAIKESETELFIKRAVLNDE